MASGRRRASNAGADKASTRQAKELKRKLSGTEPSKDEKRARVSMALLHQVTTLHSDWLTGRCSADLPAGSAENASENRAAWGACTHQNIRLCGPKQALTAREGG